MDEIRRLVVVVDLDGRNDRRNQSFSAHLFADLTDGRRVVVLDDRGWGGTAMSPNPPEDVDIWAHGTLEDLEFTARTVVGPDEPPEGMSYEEVEDRHWDYLASVLAGRGVATDGATLRELAMDVELSERVLERLRG